MKISLIKLSDQTQYRAEIVLTKKRGWKSERLVLYKLDAGHLITPFEFRHRWKYKDTQTAINALLYEVYGESIADLVYNKNPFLEICKSSPSFSVPIILPFEEK